MLRYNIDTSKINNKNMEDSATKPKVTVYSTTNCPYCHMAKDYFDKQGVVYSDVNVQEDEAARDKMIQISGQMGVPVITVEKGDGPPEITVGFDKPRLAGLLGLAA